MSRRRCCRCRLCSLLAWPGLAWPGLQPGGEEAPCGTHTSQPAAPAPAALLPPAPHNRLAPAPRTRRRLAPGGTWEGGLKLRFHNRYWQRPVWDRAEGQPMPPIDDAELRRGGGEDEYAGIGADEGDDGDE